MQHSHGLSYGGGTEVASGGRHVYSCGALWSWSAISGASARFSDDPDTAAVASAAQPAAAGGDGAGPGGGEGGEAGGDVWVVLSATYGVVEVSAAAASGAAAPSAGPAAVDAAAAAAHLMEAALSQAAAVAAAGGSLAPLAGALARRLTVLGALAGRSVQVCGAQEGLHGSPRRG
jgi:hypothetical protein